MEALNQNRRNGQLEILLIADTPDLPPDLESLFSQDSFLKCKLATIGELLDQSCDRFGEGLAAQVFDRDTNKVSHLLRVLVN